MGKRVNSLGDWYKPSELLGGSFAVSGTLQGNALHLTGGGNGSKLTLNLVKSDEAAFRSDVAALTSESNRLTEAVARHVAQQQQVKVEAGRVERMRNLTSRMKLFVAEVGKAMPKFAPVEAHYQLVTQNMQAAIVKERSIHGDGQALVARSQISVSIHQASVEADQVHISTQSAIQNFSVSDNQIVTEATALAPLCARGATDATTDRAEACHQLAAADKDFSESLSTLRAAVVSVERIWAYEHQRQDALVKASDVAAQ